MLYTQTDKIKTSTVGASFTVTFTVAPDEIGFLTVLHKMYSEMNMSGFTIKPSDSEKPNNCETCKNWDIVNDHCYFIQECRYEPQTEPQNECADCECTDDCTECKEAEHGCKDEPQTDCAWGKGEQR